MRAYDAGDLDGLGVAAAFGAAVAFAIYMVGSERAGHRHEPVTTLFWAFGFASLFWALAAPWWEFPFGELDSARNALLAAGVVVIGTLLPFICMVAALRHVPAPRAGVVATLEPVLAAVFAWVIHDEALAPSRWPAGWPSWRPWPGCSRGGPTSRRSWPRSGAEVKPGWCVRLRRCRRMANSG